MVKLVVAGVTGHVGSVVAAELAARGTPPTVIVRGEGRGASWSDRGATVATGSLDDGDFLTRTLAGADGFFTLLPEAVAPDDFHGARRRMADTIAAAVKTAGVRHVVMLSALPAALAVGSGPGTDLHYLEQQLRATGTILTALRAAYRQENVASVVPVALQAGIFPNFMASEDYPIPMVNASDIGRVAADALLAPPRSSEIIDLLGPAYSIRQVADALGAALGKRLEVVNVPASGHVTALVQGGVPRQVAEVIAEMFAAFNAGRIVPQGDRQLTGNSSIDAVIAATLR